MRRRRGLTSFVQRPFVLRSFHPQFRDAHGLEPHRTQRFKLSRDQQFVEKLTDVVGLYLNPPDKAVVVRVDEKSQIQALNRTQPGLPIKKGRCGTMTHDYKRHGTTTLFAALHVLAGTVIGECKARHRHQEIRWISLTQVQSPLVYSSFHAASPAGASLDACTDARLSPSTPELSPIVGQTGLGKLA